MTNETPTSAQKRQIDVYQENGRRHYRLTLTEGSDHAGVAPAGALRDTRRILRTEAAHLLANARADGLRVVER